MSFVGYACSRCGGRFTPEQATYRCPKGCENLDVVLDFSAAQKQDISQSRDPSLWRYAPLLPVEVPPDEAGWAGRRSTRRLAERRDSASASCGSRTRAACRRAR